MLFHYASITCRLPETVWAQKHITVTRNSYEFPRQKTRFTGLWSLLIMILLLSLLLSYHNTQKLLAIVMFWVLTVRLITICITYLMPARWTQMNSTEWLTNFPLVLYYYYVVYLNLSLSAKVIEWPQFYCIRISRHIAIFKWTTNHLSQSMILKIQSTNGTKFVDHTLLPYAHRISIHSRAEFVSFVKSKNGNQIFGFTICSVLSAMLVGKVRVIIIWAKQ